MKYLIGSGFVAGRSSAESLDRWAENIKKHPMVGLSRIVVVGVNRPMINTEFLGCGFDFISLAGNLGHVGDLISGNKPHQICGWSASICALAMLAYCDESDFIYVEEDALCFGPWVEQLYTDMGDGDMAFGHKHESEPWMECEQSLFIVRHRFIPRFVSDYLDMGRETSKDSEGNEDNLPERKFIRIEEQFGTEKIKRLSFGVGRCRPLPFDARVWYAQRFTPDEIAELTHRGLI